MSRLVGASRASLVVPSVLALVAGLLAAGLLAPRTVRAQSRSIALFPYQASIDEPAGSVGLVRLPLGPEVLEGAGADLGDLRVHDASNEEIPYAIDRGDVTYPTSTRGESRVVVAFDAHEETRTTAGVIRSTETYRVRPPAAPGWGATWELVFEPEPSELVRSVVVRAEPPFGEAREVTRTSIFRFARYGNERLVVALPGVTDEPLTIEISGEGRPIHPRFLLREIDRHLVEPATIVVPLTIRESRREGTRTLVTLERPRGLATLSLTLSSTTPSFVRGVEVRSVGAGGSTVLGQGGLVRIAGLEEPELRTVHLAPGGGDVLEVAIEDGDSPPLTDLAIEARVRVPALLFDAGRARMLRWGGHRARPPHYDLMTADVASLVRDRQLVTVQLGPRQDNPDHDDTPALRFAMRAGGVVALERYTHRASLTVPAARDGLSRVRVPAAIWAEAREDLGDLRIVDGEGRQWPYTFTAAPTSDTFEVEVGAAVPVAGEPHRSRHPITLPARLMAPTTLRVALPPQLVSRTVWVRGRNERGDEIELGIGNFLSTDDAPAELEVSLFGERVTELWLEVDDGDEAPLAIPRAVLVQPGHVLRIVAEAGSYTIVVGDLDATTPSYDLDTAWELMDVLEPEDATLGALEPNPAFHEPTFFERSGWESIVLSVALGLVVVVLFALTLRIARSEPPAPAPVPAPRQRPEPSSEEPSKPSEESSKPSEEPSKPPGGDGEPSA